MAQCQGTTIANVQCERSAKRNGWCGVCKGPRHKQSAPQPGLTADQTAQIVHSDLETSHVPSTEALRAIAQADCENIDPMPLLHKDLGTSIQALLTVLEVDRGYEELMQSLCPHDNRISLERLQGIQAAAGEAEWEINVALHGYEDESHNDTVYIQNSCETAVVDFLEQIGVPHHVMQVAMDALTEQRVGRAPLTNLQQLRQHVLHIKYVTDYRVYMATHTDDPESTEQAEALSEWLATSVRHSRDLENELRDIAAHAIGANDISALRHEKIVDLIEEACNNRNRQPQLPRDQYKHLNLVVRDEIMQNRKAIVEHAAMIKADLASLRGEEAGALFIKARPGTERDDIVAELSETLTTLTGNVLTVEEHGEIISEIIRKHNDILPPAR